jgi:hypothetical protein
MKDKVYDPNSLSVVFGGVPMSGFAEDSMLTIERENPLYKVTTDIHGVMSRCKINKDMTKITITLTQSSYSNNVLSNFVEMDRLSNSGVFPVSIKEPTGTTLFACTHAFVLESPKVEFASEEKTREWVIQASGVTQYIGN